MVKITKTHFFRAYFLNGLIMAIIAVCTVEFNFLLRYKFKISNLPLRLIYTFLFSIATAKIVFIIIALIAGKGGIISRLSNPATLSP